MTLQVFHVIDVKTTILTQPVSSISFFFDNKIQMHNENLNTESKKMKETRVKNFRVSVNRLLRKAVWF